MTDRIIAILRGVRPDEVVAIAGALVDAGITRIEVPLNSPDPFDSIAKAARELGNTADIGAGTVIRPEDVDAVHEAGGTFIVSPNCDPAVIARASAHDMPAFPGVFTPTEAFAAIAAGAAGLKFFPAELLGPAGIKAMKAVLPADMPVYAVGGAGPDNFGAFLSSGCHGFGLGSFLYKPGMTPDDVRIRADAAVAALEKEI